jgi:O-antigen/teichoic acid export membrane protein
MEGAEEYSPSHKHDEISLSPTTASGAVASRSADDPTSATSSPTSLPDESPPNSAVPNLPPVLGRLLTGTFWLALRMPLQAALAFWSMPLLTSTFGRDEFGAFNFAWNFGFIQFLLEFGMSSALQREVTERWTKGDRKGVDRAIACGLAFYALTALAQIAALLGVAYFALPHSEFVGSQYQLIIRLLWLQALTAPCYGLNVVISSILQAARRYEVIPRFELLIVALRFYLVIFGIWAGWSLLAIVATQTFVQIALGLGPAAWVMTREIGYIPKLARVGLRDFSVLFKISFYMFLIQISVVLADKVDRTILGFALADPGDAVAIYSFIAKPFEQLRQMGWMLAYLVMPAVASLVASDDKRGLDRLLYDGARMHLAAILPVGLLAWLLAAPFIDLWVGTDFPGMIPEMAYLMRLMLIATLPLLVAVQVNVAIGMGRIALIALAALAGAVVNLPLSYFLTLRLGISGVIWGTVLTTLVSNLLVPGWFAFRVAGVRPWPYWKRTLSTPLIAAISMVATVAAIQQFLPAWPLPRGTFIQRATPFFLQLSLGLVGYGFGYIMTKAGRGDASLLLRRLGGKR